MIGGRRQSDCADKFDVPPVLVFVDTVVTAAGYSKSGDDNDAAIAQRIMSVLSGLSQQTGALVVGIDHFGKVTETGTRGSSAKEGHADAVLALLADRETQRHRDQHPAGECASCATALAGSNCPSRQRPWRSAPIPTATRSPG